MTVAFFLGQTASRGESVRLCAVSLMLWLNIDNCFAARCLLLWQSIAHHVHTHTGAWTTVLETGDPNCAQDASQEPLSHTYIITAADVHGKVCGWHSCSSTHRLPHVSFKRRHSRRNYLCIKVSHLSEELISLVQEKETDGERLCK